jgi:ankyrin repeat protein
MKATFVLLVACVAGSGCYTQLQQAARDGDPARVKAALDAGASINDQAHAQFSETALHLALDGKTPAHLECVRVLLQRGASAEVQRRDGYTALCRAILVGNVEGVRLLIAHRVNLHPPCIDRALDNLNGEPGEREITALVRDAQEGKKGETALPPGAPPPEPPAAEPPPPPPPAAPGCGKDNDCKGDRICVKGECVAPK